MRGVTSPPRGTEPTSGATSGGGASGSPSSASDAERLARLIRHYTEAGPDYGTWSPSFNMHFGYRAPGMSPFRLEPMLRRMTDELLARLALPAAGTRALLDAGCGLGEPARAAARAFPRALVVGLNAVPWQLARARPPARGRDDAVERDDVERDDDVERRVRLVRGDYTRAPFAAGAFDGVYALESACYAPGRDKGAFLAEAARLLRPGGRLAIADGFHKRARAPRALARLARRTEVGWAVVDGFPVLPELVARLGREGFRDARVEEISWRVAPSVAFVPWLSARFLARGLLSGGLRGERLEVALAPLLGSVLGLARPWFGYYFVSATKG